MPVRLSRSATWKLFCPGRGTHTLWDSCIHSPVAKPDRVTSIPYRDHLPAWSTFQRVAASTNAVRCARTPARRGEQRCCRHRLGIKHVADATIILTRSSMAQPEAPTATALLDAREISKYFLVRDSMFRR